MWAHTVWANYRKRGFVCVAILRSERRWFVVAAKCYGELHFVVSINKTCYFSLSKLSPCFRYEKTAVLHNRSHPIFGVNLMLFRKIGIISTMDYFMN
jgi:hypothetical protein